MEHLPELRRPIAARMPGGLRQLPLAIGQAVDELGVVGWVAAKRGLESNIHLPGGREDMRLRQEDDLDRLQSPVIPGTR